MCEEGKKFNGDIKRRTVRSSTGRGFHPIELVHRDDLGDFLDYGFRHKLAWFVSFRIRALVLVSGLPILQIFFLFEFSYISVPNSSKKKSYSNKIKKLEKKIKENKTEKNQSKK